MIRGFEQDMAAPLFEEFSVRKADVRRIGKEGQRTGERSFFRQQAENSMKESHKRCKTLLQNSSEIRVILDEDGIERFVGGSTEAIIGFTPDELIGKYSFEFIHPDDLETLSRTFVNLKEHKPGFAQAEFRHRTKEGSWVYLEAVGTNLLDDPLIHGIVLNIRNITEQKQTEKALRESEKKYRSIFENMQDAFYRSDLKGRLILASPSGVNLLGYGSLKEVLGRKIETLYANPEDRDRFLRAIRQNDGKVTNYEVFLKRKDGSPVPVITSSAYYHDHDGNVAGIEGIFFDITERRRS